MNPFNSKNSVKSTFESSNKLTFFIISNNSLGFLIHNIVAIRAPADDPAIRVN